MFVLSSLLLKKNTQPIVSVVSLRNNRPYTRTLHKWSLHFVMSDQVAIGVNFYKAARLEPPTFQTPRLSGF